MTQNYRLKDIGRIDRNHEISFIEFSKKWKSSEALSGLRLHLTREGTAFFLFSIKLASTWALIWFISIKGMFRDRDKLFGVALIPDKGENFTLTPQDGLITLAEDESW